nr:reverse transcriptase domain-containing protein [Tanacetum cinerariifolium]
MPNYEEFLKELISNKNKIKQIFAAFLSDGSSAMIQNKVPPKVRDSGNFLIPCNFNKAFSCNALANLGVSINLMPYSLYAKLSLETLKHTKMIVRLANRSFQYPVGIAENMLVEVGKFTFPVDFVILEMEEDSKVPLILRRPFLHTANAVIRVKQKQLNLRIMTKRVIFNIDSAMKHSYSNDDTYFNIDVIDEILEEDFDALLDEGSKILHSIEGTYLEKEIFAEFDEFIAMIADENSDSEFDIEEPPFEKIPININYKIKTSLKEPPTDLELKPLPDNLEYLFLEEPSFLPVIISDAHLFLNQEKCHFMIKEGNVLGHKVSRARLEVDKAKIDVILKLSPPTNIKDLLPSCLKKILHLSSMINVKKLTCARVILSLNWNLPFKLMCDASDFAVRAVLGQKDGAENAAVDHLFRIEKDELCEDSEVDDNFLEETLMEINTKNEPWFADFANYLEFDRVLRFRSRDPIVHSSLPPNSAASKKSTFYPISLQPFRRKKKQNPFIPIEDRVTKTKYPPFENLFEAEVVYNPFLDLPFLMANDQPMWGNNRAVAPTPLAAIVAIDLGDNFTVKGHHISMIKDQKFDRHSRADPHKHITEFVEICGMCRYGNTNADAIKLKLFPSSLAGEAKIWFNELSPGVISTWEIQVARGSSSSQTRLVKREQAKPLRKTVAFTEGKENSPSLEKIKALMKRIDLQFKEIRGDLKEIRDGCNKYGGPHLSSDGDDKPIGGPKEEEANYASGGYREGYRGNYYG